MIGKKILHYEVTAKLGEGGMGIVYKARDTRLKRDVAIKFLPRQVAAGRAERKRFETEAGAAASLGHPNVAQVYAIEEADGELFIVMEYVAGRELRSVIEDEKLPLGRVIDLAAQIARGLKAAHDRGIIHRDIKSANVMVTPEEHVKIMDFGLAKVRGDTRLTRTGMTIGTPDYMSPEQVRGEEVDQRTDIWSFGVLMYEMLTGERPFKGDYAQAVMYSILNGELRPPSRHVPTLPRTADEIVMKMLARDRDNRPPTMDRLMDMLDSLRDGAPARQAAAGAPAETGKPRLPTVAVLPFGNMSNDPEHEFFADGITADVIAHLAKIKTLRVTSLTSVMAFKKREHSLREISSILGVGAIVEGSVRHSRNRVRIVAQLVDPESGQSFWAETYDRDMDDIFAIQTDVALQIVNALSAELTAAERARIGAQPTRDLGAYQLYLRGRYLLTRYMGGAFLQSIPFFEGAIARDPDFALAHAQLAHAHIEIGITGIAGTRPLDAFARAQNSIDRALKLDVGLAEAHGMAGLLLFVRDFEWKRAEAELRLALQLSPSNADVCDHLGWLLSAQERHEEALELVTKARDLDPLAHHSDIANTLLRAGRPQEALEAAERTLATHPDYVRSHSVFGWACLKLGRTSEGLASLEHAAEMESESTLFLAQLGQAYGMTGDHAKARAVLADLQARAEREYVADSHFAYVYTGLGEYDRAIDLLERAYEERTSIYSIKGSYLFAPLRGHPRFEALLRKMNL